MIIVNFLGSAKKSFSTDKLEIEKDFWTVHQLLGFLQKNVQKNMPPLDVKNMLVAINGIDSSSLQGLSTNLKDGDIVSIIPIIHGGNIVRRQFRVFKTRIELMGIKGINSPIKFLEDLRQKHIDLVIQGLKSCYVLNADHAKKIITISLLAKKTDTLLSTKLETDILMRFACTTQINEAIQKAGLQSKQDFILIAIGKKASLDKLYKELEIILEPKIFSHNNSNFIKREFRISQKQLKSLQLKTKLEDLLAEKSAVLVR